MKYRDFNIFKIITLKFITKIQKIMIRCGEDVIYPGKLYLYLSALHFSIYFNFKKSLTKEALSLDHTNTDFAIDRHIKLIKYAKIRNSLKTENSRLSHKMLIHAARGGFRKALIVKL